MIANEERTFYLATWTALWQIDAQEVPCEEDACDPQKAHNRSDTSPSALKIPLKQYEIATVDRLQQAFMPAMLLQILPRIQDQTDHAVVRTGNQQRDVLVHRNERARPIAGTRNMRKLSTINY